MQWLLKGLFEYVRSAYITLGSNVTLSLPHNIVRRFTMKVIEDQIISLKHLLQYLTCSEHLINVTYYHEF